MNTSRRAQRDMSITSAKYRPRTGQLMQVVGESLQLTHGAKVKFMLAVQQRLPKHNGLN
jgi:hypothetical protein